MGEKGFIQKLTDKLTGRKDQKKPADQSAETRRPAEPTKESPKESPKQQPQPSQPQQPGQPQQSKQRTASDDPPTAPIPLKEGGDSRKEANTETGPQPPKPARNSKENEKQNEAAKEQNLVDYQSESAKKSGVFKTSGKAMAEAVDAQQREVAELVQQVREMIGRTDRALEQSQTPQSLPPKLQEAIENIGEQNRRLSESLEGISAENRRQAEALEAVRTALDGRRDEQLAEQVQALTDTLEEMKKSSQATASLLKQVRDRLLEAHENLSKRVNQHATRLNRMFLGMVIALGVVAVAVVMAIVLIR